MLQEKSNVRNTRKICILVVSSDNPSLCEKIVRAVELVVVVAAAAAEQSMYLNYSIWYAWN
jgi:hypothetical protein